MSNQERQPETLIAALVRKITEQAHGDMACVKHECEKKPGAPHVLNGQTYSGAPICQLCEQERKDELREVEHHRRMKAMRRRFSDMGIPERYQGVRIKDFICTSPDQAAVVAVSKRFCNLDIEPKDDWTDEDYHNAYEGKESITNLLFLGNVGTGKTLLSCGILTDFSHGEDGEYLSSGHYGTAAHLIRRIKSTWRKDSEESEQGVIDKLGSVDLLAIDEIGVQFSSETERMLLTEILNERYNRRRSTVIASNLTLAELTTVIGERAVDRLREGGKVCVFDWPSQRWGTAK